VELSKEDLENEETLIEEPQKMPNPIMTIMVYTGKTIMYEFVRIAHNIMTENQGADIRIWDKYFSLGK
jgi:hypothetical protein